MNYEIHGKQVIYDGSECGIYKSPGPLLRLEYAIMDLDHLVRAINGLSKDIVIEEVTKLRDQAAEQAKWQYTPQNQGAPILRQIPPPIVFIDEVRGNIRNTERFCNDVLKALKGE